MDNSYLIHIVHCIWMDIMSDAGVHVRVSVDSSLFWLQVSV